MSSRNKLSFFIIVLFVVSSASVFADTIEFTFTDTTSEQPGSMFTLTLVGSGLHWSATLTVNTVATSPDWYINYLTLHLDGGQRPSVMNFNGPPNWNIIGDGNPQEDVHKRNSFPQNSWIGLYTTGILDDDSIDITQGVLLENGGSATWTFDFWLAPGSILNESPSIQVGYFNYDETRGGRRGGKIFFTQRSKPSPNPLPSSSFSAAPDS